MLATGRRTVTAWIRAAGLSADYRCACTALAAAGRRADGIACRLLRGALGPLRADTDRLTFGLADTPTPRYGRHVEGAGRSPQEMLRSRYPKTHRYLSGHRDALARRKGAAPWHALRSAACLSLPPGPPLLLKLICSGGDFTLDPGGSYLGHGGMLMLAPDVRQLDPHYLLGVMNSQVF